MSSSIPEAMDGRVSSKALVHKYEGLRREAEAIFQENVYTYAHTGGSLVSAAQSLDNFIAGMHRIARLNFTIQALQAFPRARLDRLQRVSLYLGAGVKVYNIGKGKSLNA